MVSGSGWDARLASDLPELAATRPGFAHLAAVAGGVVLLAAEMLYGFWNRLSSASSSWTRASALTRASRSASARPCWSS